MNPKIQQPITALLLLIPCGILAAGAGFVLSAQSVKDDLVFRRFDKNDDGKVTTDELPNPQAL